MKGEVMKFKQRNQAIKDFDLRVKLSQSYQLPTHISELLINRGISSLEEADEFLNPTFNHLHDPFLMKGMSEAVQRIHLAIKRNETILIFGDYDADGVSATAILYLALTQKGVFPSVYIPHRHEEGYGINDIAVERILNSEYCPSLIITVDCGIKSKDHVQQFMEKGIDVIVTDHHLVPETVPNCIAVLNPHQPDCLYPYKELCGAGVSFKLVQGLFGIQYASQFLDLASIGTVGDLMPLTGENRAIVSLGLSFLNTIQEHEMKPAFRLIKDYMVKQNHFSGMFKASDIAFTIAPLINATGRISHANKALEFFVLDDITAAREPFDFMLQANDYRKSLQSEMVASATKKITTSQNRLIMLYEENWNVGLVGLVASALIEEHYCPTLVMSLNPETGILHGSGRSIEGINLFELLSRNEHLFISFGGHEGAAGFKLKLEHFEELKHNLEQELDLLDDQLFERTFLYDLEVDLENVDTEYIQSLDRLEPTGQGNPKPVALLSNMVMTQAETIGKDKQHYKARIMSSSQSDIGINGIKFYSGIPKTKVGIDIIGTFDLNCFRGNVIPQLMIQKVAKHPFDDTIVQYNTKSQKSLLYDEQTGDGLFGITEQKAKQFKSKKIETNVDLVHLVPRKYTDFRKTKLVKEFEEKEIGAIKGTVFKMTDFMTGFTLHCRDENDDYFKVVYFNQRFLKAQFALNCTYIFGGTMQSNEYQGTITKQLSPICFTSDIESGLSIVPSYQKIKSMSDTYLEEKIFSAMHTLPYTDYLSKDLVKKFDLLTTPEMLRKIHRPEDLEEVKSAQKRLIFDKLFRFSMQLKLNEPAYQKYATKFNSFNIIPNLLGKLPYSLTNDQLNTVREISKIAKRGERINALVQGDVGCGKTIVALLLMFSAYENGLQSTLVAPTEILAFQHYQDLQVLAEKIQDEYSINIAYLSGSTKAKEKREIISGLKNGTIHMVVGTHAILSKEVEFQNLGMFIIDEEHKFGVKQRERLNEVASIPHTISMSATPIPRSLSLSMYNDSIQVFTILEKPASRKGVKTIQMNEDDTVYQFMLEQIKNGRQCYVVCPAIEGVSDLKSVASVELELKQWFSQYPEIKIGAISGKMKKSDSNHLIDQFKQNTLHILVSTTMIEVGVNIPNASVMVLKQSDRFGLAQAHQLRGRVGRGEYEGYCILQPENEEDRKAKILCSTNNGFEISKEDLKLRGTGDFIGTSQTGNNEEVSLMLSYPHLFGEIINVVKSIIVNPIEKKKYIQLLDLEENSLLA